MSRARVWLYTQFEIQRGLPVQRMVRWFDQTEAGWLAKADLRRRIDFTVQNMLVDRPPLTAPADLIFCRNRSEERRVGKECVVRVDLGGRSIIKKKKPNRLYINANITYYTQLS